MYIVLHLCSGLCFFRGSLHLEQKEEEFVVYEPYCANYTNASELMLMEEQNLVVRLTFDFLRSAALLGLLGDEQDRLMGGNCRNSN
jgi:hypothetical protein